MKVKKNCLYFNVVVADNKSEKKKNKIKTFGKKREKNFVAKIVGMVFR